MKLVRALILPVLVVVTLLGGTAAPASASLSRVPTTAPVGVASSGALFEDQVMVQINIARVSAGLKPVRFFDSCLERMALGWGRSIAASGNLVHRDQQGVLDKCDQVWAGEALIRGESLTPQSVVDAWLASPPHRAILLKPRATRAGLAVVVDAQGRQVGVLNLAADR